MHFVLPGGVDDPAQPSGGNIYDRRLIGGLRAAGWQLHEHVVAGGWPHPARRELDDLARTLRLVPAGELVLVDGLIGSAAPDTLAAETDRLRLVLLVHMPFGGTDHAARVREATALRAATAVITTSGWTRDQLTRWYGALAERVHVAHPGVDPAAAVTGTAAGRELICVAAVAGHKGHDVLVDALAELADLLWRCRCVGPLDRDPAFVGRLRARIDEHGLADRIELTGPRTGAELDRCYASADLLVSASRGETYGMALAEALAHALPVVATEVGGVREALGRSGAGLPGLLVPPDDPAALTAALRRWLTEPALRTDLREAAAARRVELPTWAATVDRVARALAPAGAATG